VGPYQVHSVPSSPLPQRAWTEGPPPSQRLMGSHPLREPKLPTDINNGTLLQPTYYTTNTTIFTDCTQTLSLPRHSTAHCSIPCTVIHIRRNQPLRPSGNFRIHDAPKTSQTYIFRLNVARTSYAHLPTSPPTRILLYESAKLCDSRKVESPGYQ